MYTDSEGIILRQIKTGERMIFCWKKYWTKREMKWRHMGRRRMGCCALKNPEYIRLGSQSAMTQEKESVTRLRFQ